MSIYVDRKFIGLIQFRLEGFAQKKQDLYICRCPFCMDSKKSKTKKRGYIYKLKNVETYAYRCHNCGKSISLGSLLQELDESAYKAYVLEKYKEGSNRSHPVEKPTFDELRGNVLQTLNSRPKKLSISTIYDLPDGHYAKSYIINRRIDQKFWREIYFTDNFKSFMDEEFPNHEHENLPEDDRIILPYTEEDGVVTHIAGRALGDSKLRYITIKVGNVERKVFGTHRLDLSKPAFVVEGQFDSFFLDNCVASGDSNLYSVAEYYKTGDWTLIFDNEPRNREICKQMNKAIKLNHKIVIYPENIVEKDINDMVQSGIDVRKLISENTFSGAVAILKFLRWKRV